MHLTRGLTSTGNEYQSTFSPHHFWNERMIFESTRSHEAPQFMHPLGNRKVKLPTGRLRLYPDSTAHGTYWNGFYISHLTNFRHTFSAAS